MTIILNTPDDLCECENLIMMADFCKRYYQHEYAVNAVNQLRAAREVYIKEFQKQRELFCKEQKSKGETI